MGEGKASTEQAHRERVQRLQENMAAQGVDVFMVLTQDDYIYFVGEMRRQPRALIPRQGEPIPLVFASEVEEVRQVEVIVPDHLQTDEINVALSEEA